MNKLNAAYLAAGASTGALVSFLLTRRHYIKANDELFDQVKDYYYDRGYNDGNHGRVPETFKKKHEKESGKTWNDSEDFDRNEIAINPVVAQDLCGHIQQPPVAYKEEEDEHTVELNEQYEEFVESYAGIPDDATLTTTGGIAIEDSDTWYLIQGYEPVECIYDKASDIFYEIEGYEMLPKEEWLERRNELYGYDRWPHTSQRQDLEFSAIDHVNDKKYLIKVPAVFSEELFER